MGDSPHRQTGRYAIGERFSFLLSLPSRSFAAITSYSTNVCLGMGGFRQPQAGHFSNNSITILSISEK